MSNAVSLNYRTPVPYRGRTVPVSDNLMTQHLTLLTNLTVLYTPNYRVH